MDNRSGVIEAAADAPDVWRAYENLWKAASRQRPEAVAVPLLAPVSPAPRMARKRNCASWVLP
jgi:hypothetical protein